MDIPIKRVYDAPAASDGIRILVDRLWPRGIAKDKVDRWMKEVAPSTALRQWFAHDPAKWSEFQLRYRTELEGNPAVAELRALAQASRITLLYAARDQVHNDAVVLKQVLEADH